MGEAMQAMVDASSFDAKDAQLLTALVQTDDDEEEIRQTTSRRMRPTQATPTPLNPGAPVYKNKSRGIVDTLRAILETAEANLAALRNTEMVSIKKFEKLKISIVHSIETDTKALTTYKESYSKSNTELVKFSQEKTEKKTELARDVQRTEELNKQFHDAEETNKAKVESQKREIRVLTKVIRLLVRQTRGAQQIKYRSVARRASADFMQLSSESTHQLIHAVHLVQTAAKTSRSTALAQLADKMSDAMSDASTDVDESADPFAMVRGMIKSMIDNLEKQSRKETTRDQFCRNEMKNVQEDLHT